MNKPALFDVEQIPPADAVVRDADISPCGRYRYSLSRTWEPRQPHVLWIMLNPSTADASIDDPTIRKCVKFSKRWGYGGMVVVNLYAYRATDPREMKSAQGPIGEWVVEGNLTESLNDRVIAAEAAHADCIICAWGAEVGPVAERPRQVLDLLPEHEWYLANVYALGVAKNGQPRHPLYMRDDTDMAPFTLPGEER